MKASKVNRVKYIVLVCLLSSLSSCSYIRLFFTKSYINRKESVKVKTDCGDITFSTQNASITGSGKPNGDWTYIYIHFSGEGYKVCFDSLNFVFPDNDYEVSRREDYYKHRPIERKSLQLHDNDSLRIELLFKPVKSISAPDSTTTLMILPCGYIKCNGNNVIKDTIRIKSRGFRDYTVM